MNRVVARYLLLVVNCLFLTRNNLWYSAYFKVHFQYQIKVVLDTKFYGFFFSQIINEIFIDRFVRMT